MSDAQAYADALVQGIQEVTDGYWDGKRDPGAMEHWFADVLELKAITEHTGNGSDMVAAEALVTYGGPNAWVRSSGEDYVQVSVYWGSDEAHEYVHAPTLSYLLWEYCEQLQPASKDMW